MAAKRVCKVCREKPATVPDRYAGMGRPRKEICRDCHAKRLAGDFYAAAKRLSGGK